MTFFSRNLKTYTGAITNKAVTEHMARKLSGSSLKLEDLAKVVKFYGLAGFEELICGHQDGKARITKTKAVVKKLFNYINKEYVAFLFSVNLVYWGTNDSNLVSQSTPKYFFKQQFLC